VAGGEHLLVRLPEEASGVTATWSDRKSFALEIEPPPGVRGRSLNKVSMLVERNGKRSNSVPAWNDLTNHLFHHLRSVNKLLKHPNVAVIVAAGQENMLAAGALDKLSERAWKM